MEQNFPGRSKSRAASRSPYRSTDALAPRFERESIQTEGNAPAPPRSEKPSSNPGRKRFEPPISALGPLFRSRLQRIHLCRVPYDLDINPRATNRVLGGYYKSRRLVRIYVHDSEQGRRPLDELFDTFLHEIAHHLEYTEPRSFSGKACQRVPGRMHSRLFWKILSDLKQRWARLNDPSDGSKKSRLSF